MENIWELKDPQRVQIQPSYSCNLGCIFCWKTIKENDDLEELPDDKWIEIVKQLCDMNINKIIISGGGEPLVRKDLILRLMKIIKENEVKGNLVTNGTLLDEDSIKTIVNIEWDEINFSIHSPRQEVSDKLRDKKGSSKETMDNLEKLKNIKKDQEKPKISISVVINEYNYDHLKEFEDFAEKYGINHINLRILQGEPPECKFVPESDIENFLGGIKELKKSKKTNFHLTFSLSEVEDYYE